MAEYDKKKTIVIGHKNPDTDSICSAICYANLKSKATGQEFMPGRAGQVNGETQFAVRHPKQKSRSRDQDSGPGILIHRKH